jgi:TolB protein
MKIPPTLFLILVALTLSSAFAADASRKLGFARNDAVWVSNLDGTAAKKIAAGVNPDISPDGTRLAFNTEGKGTERYIAVASLVTGKVTIFTHVPSGNCFGPVWAPDGGKLLFYIYIDNTWDIGLANTDGSGFRILKKGTSDSHSFYSACWMPDGQSLYCQDLDNIYRIALDGAVIKQWPLQKLIPGSDMDSNMRFSISPDGGTLLVEQNSEAVPERKDWDGPAPSVWSIDLSTMAARKLTPQFWWEPRWLSATEYLCICQSAKENQPSIYRVTVDGKIPPARKLVIKNATDPSVSK